MAEEEERGAASSRGASGADPSAMALALGAEARNAGAAAQAEAYLKEQTRLARIQAERLEAEEPTIVEQQRLELSHLRLRRFNDYSKTILEVGVGFFLMAVVLGACLMVWSAANDHDLVIDAFSVPPDFAARGITGEVVAAELLDRFSKMESETQSTAQSEGTHRLDAGNAIRLEIPEAGGLSLTEVDHYLRQMLGHETHVAGEIVRTADGIVLALRAGGVPGIRIEGKDTDLGGLLQRGAENLFAQSEPLRYADHLYDTNRLNDAIAALRPMTLMGSPLDRARALTSWAEALDFDGRAREALPIIRRAIDIAPQASFARAVGSDVEEELGHDEAARTDELETVRTASTTWTADELRAAGLTFLPYYIGQRGDWHSGDYGAAENNWKLMYAGGASGVIRADVGTILLERVPQRAAAHDLAAARDMENEASGIAVASSDDTAYSSAIIAYYGDNWRGVTESASKFDAQQHNAHPNYTFAWQLVQVRPLYAIAIARLGNFSRAEAIVAQTPADCDLCARARGTIAALEHNWNRAAYWFALVAARTPHIPFADTDWGQTLLWKGDDEGAIAKFELANAIGPNFADPLEMWGEALIREDRSDLAAVKFAEADKHAPNWGRLHLKWGEALLWSGKVDAAKKQFAVAATLDLSPVEKAELARVRAAHG